MKYYKIHPKEIGISLDENYYIPASSEVEASFILDSIMINKVEEIKNVMHKRIYYQCNKNNIKFIIIQQYYNHRKISNSSVFTFIEIDDINYPPHQVYVID